MAEWCTSHPNSTNLGRPQVFHVYSWFIPIVPKVSVNRFRKKRELCDSINLQWRLSE
jgi:hypothetical protein